MNTADAELKKRQLTISRQIEVNKIEGEALSLGPGKSTNRIQVDDFIVIQNIKQRLCRVKGMSFKVQVVQDEINTIIIDRIS